MPQPETSTGLATQTTNAKPSIDTQNYNGRLHMLLDRSRIDLVSFLARTSYATVLGIAALSGSALAQYTQTEDPTYTYMGDPDTTPPTEGPTYTYMGDPDTTPPTEGPTDTDTGDPDTTPPTEGPTDTDTGDPDTTPPTEGPTDTDTGDPDTTSQTGSPAPTPGGLADANVDLFTGKLKLSVPLGTLNDSSSPSFSLASNYNGNTLVATQIWNSELPTNDLGLGWALSTQNVITRYTSGTGTTNDDIIYLDGQELIYTSTQDNVDTYHLKVNHSNSKIYHDRTVTPSQWMIVGSDGIKTYFGGLFGKEKLFTTTTVPDGEVPSETSELFQDADPALLQACTAIRGEKLATIDGDYQASTLPQNDCDTGSVEYGVKWGNWTGPRFSDKGQQHIELAWHLSAIEDLAGNRTTFSYVQHVQNVGDGQKAKAFSKGAYLYKISQKSGQNLSLWYCSRTKGASDQTSGENSQDNGWGGDCGNTSGPHYREYEDPWFINVEPDAYQERVRSLYLGAVGVFTKDATQPIGQTRLGYQFQTSGTDALMAKRMLTSVSIYANTRHEGMTIGHLTTPPYRFSYYGEDDGVCVTRSGDGTGASCPEKQVLLNPENGALYGALKTVETPLGNKKTYRYTAQNVETRRDADLPEELTQRQVLFGDNYALVMGETTQRGYIYQWTEFGWKQTRLPTGVNHKCEEYGCDGVALGIDVLAFLDSQGKAYLARNRTRDNQWEVLSLGEKIYDKVVLNRYFVALRHSEQTAAELSIFDLDGNALSAPSGFKMDAALGLGLDYLVGVGSNNRAYVSIFDTKTRTFSSTFSDDFHFSNYELCDNSSDSTATSAVIFIYFSVCEVLDTINAVRVHGESIYFMVGGKTRQGYMSCPVPYENACANHSTVGHLQGSKPIAFQINDNRSGFVKKSLNLPNYLGASTRQYSPGSDNYILSSSTSNLGATWSMTILDGESIDAFDSKKRSYGFCYFLPVSGTLKTWKTMNKVQHSELPDCSAGSFVNGGTNVSGTRNGEGQLTIRPYDPKVGNWINSGNVAGGSFAEGSYTHATALLALESIQEILGDTFLIAGFADFPVGTIISSVFLALKVAIDELSKDVTVTADPRSVSLNQRYINDGNSLWFVTHGGKAQPLGSSQDGSGSLIKGIKGENLASSRFSIGTGFIPFTTSRADTLKTYVRLLRNGEMGRYLDLKVDDDQIVNDQKDTFQTVSGSNFITYAANDDKKLSSSNGAWHLYRFVQDTAVGHVTDYVVSQVIHDDGVSTYKTDYDFDPANAGYNATGMYATSSYHPGGRGSGNGHTTYHFYNGKNAQHIVPVTLEGTAASIDHDSAYARLLASRMYKVETFRDSLDEPVMSKDSQIEINQTHLYSGPSRTFGHAFSAGAFLYTPHARLGGKHCAFFVSENSLELKDCTNAKQTTPNILFINGRGAIQIGGTDDCLIAYPSSYTRSHTIWKVGCSDPNFMLLPGARVIPYGSALRWGTAVDEGRPLCIGGVIIPDVKKIDYRVVNCGDYHEGSIDHNLAWEFLQRPITATHYDLRVKSTTEKRDGVSLRTLYDYNAKRQLKRKSTTHSLFRPKNPSVGYETLVTDYTYAWEKYEPMAEQNQLNASFQTVTTRQVNDDTPVRVNAQVATYKDWGANPQSGRDRIWLAQCTYRAKAKNAADFAVPDDDASCAPTSRDWNPMWELTSAIENREPGLELPIASRDIAGVLSRTVLMAGESGRPVATFHHSEVGDAAYYGAETYERIPFTLPEEVEPSADQAFTGYKSLKFGKRASVAASAPVSMGRTYTIGAWVYVANAAPRITPCTLGFGDDVVQPEILASRTWSYVHHTSSEAGEPTLTCDANTYVDDLHYSPVDAGWSAIVYDVDNARVTASLGPDGANAHKVYAPVTRMPYIGYSHDHTQPGVVRASAFNLVGWSRFGGYAVEDTDSPTSASYDLATPNTSAAFGISGTSEYLHAIGPGAPESLFGAVGPNFVFRAVVSNLESGNYLQVVTPDGSDNLRIQYDSVDAGQVSLTLSQGDVRRSASLPDNFLPSAFTIMVLGDPATSKGSAFVWVDGKLVLSVKDELKPFDDQATIGNDSTMDLSYVLFARDPIVTLSYADAMGRVIQSHGLHLTDQGELEDVMSGVIYDGWGKAALTTKVAAPNSLTSSHCDGYTRTGSVSLLGYCSDFMTAYDWSDLASPLAGKVADYWRDQGEIAVGDKDHNYAFTLQTRYPYPSARSNRTSLAPGYAYNPQGERSRIQDYYHDRQFLLDVHIPKADYDQFYTPQSDEPFSAHERRTSETLVAKGGRFGLQRSGSYASGFITSATDYDYSSSALPTHRDLLRPLYEGDNFFYLSSSDGSEVLSIDESTAAVSWMTKEACMADSSQHCQFRNESPTISLSAMTGCLTVSDDVLTYVRGVENCAGDDASRWRWQMHNTIIMDSDASLCLIKSSNDVLLGDCEDEHGYYSRTTTYAPNSYPVRGHESTQQSEEAPLYFDVYRELDEAGKILVLKKSLDSTDCLTLNAESLSFDYEPCPQRGVVEDDDDILFRPGAFIFTDFTAIPSHKNSGLLIAGGAGFTAYGACLLGNPDLCDESVPTCFAAGDKASHIMVMGAQSCVEGTTAGNLDYVWDLLSDHRLRSRSNGTCLSFIDDDNPVDLSECFNIGDVVKVTTQKDILGRHTVLVDPDREGETHVFSDSTGFVRFICHNYVETDTSQGCAYFKRDSLGRLVSGGVLKNKTGSPSEYRAWANDMTFPDDDEACVSEQYFHDYAFDIAGSFDSDRHSFAPSDALVGERDYQGKLFAVARLRTGIPDKPGIDCGTHSSPVVVNYYGYDQWGNRDLIGTATQSLEDVESFTFRNTAYTYDEGGKLESVTYPTEDTSQFSIEPTQSEVHYFYNGLQQLDRVCNSSDCAKRYASDYRYNISGDIVSMGMDDDQLSTTYTYDFQSRSTRQKTTKGDETIFQEVLSYESAADGSGYQGGNIRSIDFSGSGLQGSDHGYTYSYDIWSRLTGAQKRVSDEVTQGFTYRHDPNGNIIGSTRTDASGSAISDLTYTYEAGSNRLKTITDRAGEEVRVRRFDDYDVWGGINTMTSSELSLGENRFTREAKTGKVLAIENDLHRTSFSYDALGRRTEKSVH